MKTELLELLCCPSSGQKLEISDAHINNDAIESGWLNTPDGKYSYPIKNYVPRFVPESNYADNFGMQWNKFRLTQMDSYTNIPISENRFYHATNWNKNDLKDKWILDVGCGAGRFAEVALKAGANVIALDYSRAVDACWSNLGHYENLTVVQGDIYALPFAKKSFDYVYSHGVLQHTPDVKKPFFSLVPYLKDGGNFCVDFYEKSWKSSLLPKYWLRPITKKIPKVKLFKALQKLVPILLPISVVFSRIPLIGKVLKRVVPVANYVDDYPLKRKEQLEWSLLDTFDWFSPEYDNPQNEETVTAWLKEANMKDIEVLKAGHLVGRARSLEIRYGNNRRD